MLSQDRKRFYCDDTFVGTWVFDVRPDLTLSNQRMLLDKPDADGMALDADGNIWITGFRSGSAVPAAGGDSLKDGVPLRLRESHLYRGRSQIPGMPIPAAQFIIR
jgi:sugar lactone lactonase YvrE